MEMSKVLYFFTLLFSLFKKAVPAVQVLTFCLRLTIWIINYEQGLLTGYHVSSTFLHIYTDKKLNFIYSGLRSFPLVYFLFHNLMTSPWIDNVSLSECFTIPRKLKEIKFEEMRGGVLFSFEILINIQILC
jgi:hypothetical protein